MVVKYCVLEDGILCFYQNVDDANSREAIQERKPSDLLTGDNSPTNTSGVDLSKSPMASRRTLINIASPDNGSLLGSNSEVTSNSTWEKRVALNCVGAV